MRIVHSTLHLVYEAFLRCKLLFRITLCKRCYRQDSYYPELESKSASRQFVEHAVHILRYGEIDCFYYLYGLDIVGFRNSNDFIDYRSFMSRRNRLNLASPHNYTCILRDKSLFATIASAFGFPCIKELGIYNPAEDRFVPAGCENLEGGGILTVLQVYPELFFKLVDAECGEDIFCLSLRHSALWMDDKAIDKTALYDNLHRIKRKFLVQTRLVQHEEMNRLYPTSVNTLRIVTVYDRTTGEVEVLHTLLRVGAHGNVVDNWAKGGLAIAVDSDGRLAEYGFYKPQFGNKVNKHPDSRIVFKTFVVPYFQEALHMTKAFHEKLSGIHSIGWDVAITPQGPVFIEGNDNWEISLHQAFSGLRMRINHLFPNE